MSPTFTTQFKPLSSFISCLDYWDRMLTNNSLISGPFFRTSALHLVVRVINLNAKRTLLFLLSWRVNSEDAGVWCLSASFFHSLPWFRELLACNARYAIYPLLLLIFAYDVPEMCSETATVCSHHCSGKFYSSFKTQLRRYFFIKTFPNLPKLPNYLSSVGHFMSSSYSSLYIVCLSYYAVI